jgi:hypothetical protein
MKTNGLDRKILKTLELQRYFGADCTPDGAKPARFRFHAAQGVHGLEDARSHPQVRAVDDQKEIADQKKIGQRPI